MESKEVITAPVIVFEDKSLLVADGYVEYETIGDLKFRVKRLFRVSGVYKREDILKRVQKEIKEFIELGYREDVMELYWLMEQTYKFPVPVRSIELVEIKYCDFVRVVMRWMVDVELKRIKGQRDEMEAKYLIEKKNLEILKVNNKEMIELNAKVNKLLEEERNKKRWWRRWFKL